MCGIVGIVAKNNSGFHGDLPELFEEMLWADAVRGMDATGCFQVSKKNEVNVAKQATDPGIFFRTNLWKTFKHRINKDSTILVGHNRAATVGDKEASKNAHPFVKGDIALVHNGYISNWKSLDEKAEVDSQAIVTVLNKEKEPEKAVNELFGAWAVVWYNHKTKKLYLTRNNDRPLSIVNGQDFLFFMSEPDMMNWIFKRNKYNNQPDAKEIKPHTVVEISLNPFKMETRELPKRTFPVSRSERGAVEGDQACSPWSPFAHAFRDQAAADAEFELESRTGELAPAPRSWAEDNEVDASGKIMKMYPARSMVFFEPKAAIPQGSGPYTYMKVRGVAWAPGKPAQEAVWICEDGEKELYLPKEGEAAPLLADVTSYISKNGNFISLGIDRVREPRSTVDDWNGQVMSDTEWDLVYGHELCGKCGGSPRKTAPEYTQVNRKDGTYDVICDKCTQHIVEGQIETANAQATQTPETKEKGFC